MNHNNYASAIPAKDAAMKGIYCSPKCDILVFMTSEPLLEGSPSIPIGDWDMDDDVIS